MATKRKKKPNCGKGQACGYSCIPQYNKDGTKRGCGQPVPKEAAEENLAAIPAKGKGGSKKAAQSDKVKMRVKYLYMGDEKDPTYTDGQRQLDAKNEAESYLTQREIDYVLKRNKERGLDIKVGEKVVEVKRENAEAFKKYHSAEEIEGPKAKPKATEAKPKVDDKTAQSAFKEIRKEQETTGTGVVAVSADQLKAKLKSKAKISDKEADNVYEDLKKRKKIFTVKEKDRELIYWND